VLFVAQDDTLRLPLAEELPHLICVYWQEMFQTLAVLIADVERWIDDEPETVSPHAG